MSFKEQHFAASFFLDKRHISLLNFVIDSTKWLSPFFVMRFLSTFTEPFQTEFRLVELLTGSSRLNAEVLADASDLDGGATLLDVVLFINL